MSRIVIAPIGRIVRLHLATKEHQPAWPLLDLMRETERQARDARQRFNPEDAFFASVIAEYDARADKARAAYEAACEESEKQAHAAQAAFDAAWSKLSPAQAEICAEEIRKLYK